MKKFFRIGCILLLIAVLMTAVFSCTKEGNISDPTEDPQGEQKSIADLEREWEEAHSFTYVVTTEPTETTEGEAVGICADCGLRTTVFLPALSADLYQMEERQATCTTDGSRTYTSKYGTFTVTIKALGHDYRRTVEPATCQKDGSDVSVCSRCGDRQEKVLPQEAHAYEVETRVEGSCTTYGYTKYRCATCGEEYIQRDKEYTHDYDDGQYVAVSCASEEKYGYTLYTCRNCSATKIVRDKTPSHVYNKDTGACDVCGEKCSHAFEDYVCTVCGLDIEERVQEDGYYLADDDGNGRPDVGETVYFGTYPQRIADKTIVAALRSTPIGEDGYYEYDGKKYARKTLDQRWKATTHFSNGQTVSSYADYEADDHIYDYYYYRVEPIRWTVTAVDEEGATLRSDYILGVAEYKAKGSYRASGSDYYATDNGALTEYYADDWAASDLRAYLNGTFRQTAFSETQKSMLVTKTIKNDKETNYHQSEYADNGDTQDDVYIDAFGEIFGEEETPTDASFERMKTGTDYAIGSGLNVNNDHHPYFTRSVGRSTLYVGSITTEGKFDDMTGLYFEKDDAGQTVYGVGFLPLVTIKTISN